MRVIDELPNVLAEKLTEGKSLTLISLPELEEDGSDDEHSDEFLLALEQARHADDTYRDSLALIDESERFSGKSGEVERAPKTRVRTELGMPVREKTSFTSSEDHAASLGLEPSYDVPKPDAQGPLSAAHTDRFLQTLLLPDAMERRLSGVYENALIALREKGVNTLYCAFGCLEWLESDSSDRAFFAPLILQPVEMRRELQRGEYRYTIASTGDEPVMNITLAERLRRDFGLGLPVLAEEDTPETYFEKVAEMAEARKRWRVRRFITVGHFAFARLVMYQDLNPEQWPEGRKLEQHGVISDLLGGTDRDEPVFADEYDIDDPRVENAVPMLITDADSSQHSAIMDVMQGHNRVIEGPPGTGKSQTITNIIAAAMAKSKTALFVAEKMAALEVVKNRLDHAGLGHFCLDLHSTKAKKVDLLASLKKRDEIQSRLTPPANLEERLAELRAVRAQLTRYAETLNRRFGVLGKTVQQLLWAEQRTRHIDDDLPQQLRQVRIKNARDISEAAVDKALEKLRAFERIHASLADEFVTPHEHPWSWVNNPLLTPFDVEDLVAALRRWGDSLDVLKTEWERGETLLGGYKIASIAEVRTPLNWLAELPVENKSVSAEMLPHLASTLSRAAGDEFCRDVRNFHACLEAQSELINQPRQTLDDHLTSLEQALEQTHNVHEDCLPLPVSQLDPTAKNCFAWSARYARLARECTALLAHLGANNCAPPSLSSLSLVFAALDLLTTAERPWLLLRETETIDELNRQIIREAAIVSAQLNEEQIQLGQQFILSEAMEEAMLRKHAVALRDAGFFGRLLPRVRRATQFFQGLHCDNAKLKRNVMADCLVRLADFVRGRANFLSDIRVQGACGRHFHGLKTDFGNLVLLTQWAERVRSELAGNDELTRAVRAALLMAPMEVLDTVAALAGEAEFASARELMHKPGLSVDDAPLREKADEFEKSALVLQTLSAQILAAGCKPEMKLNQLKTVVADLQVCRDLAARATENRTAREILGEEFRGVESPIADLRITLLHAGFLAALEPSSEIAARLFHRDGFKYVRELKTLGARLEEALTEVQSGFASVDELANLDGDLLIESDSWEATAPSALKDFINHALRCKEAIAPWLDFLRARKDAEDLSLGPFLRAFESSSAPLRGLDVAYRRVLYRSCIKQAMEDWPEIAQFSGAKQSDAQKRFRQIDRESFQLYREQLSADLASRPVNRGVGIGPKRDWTERSLILNEIHKEKRHIPIRDLLQRAGNAILQMKPCLMMSPMSVSQFLVSGQHQFDLVVIDEASQMRPEDSLGAIARGKQFVVVGDPKQLPPTPFFNRMDDGDDVEEEEETVESESILDLALGVFRPPRRLRWHYRSRHGSLIAFSNKQFYEGKLVVFPSPREKHPEFGVQMVQVQGSYRARMNIPEVQAVAETAVDFMCRFPTRSLGIATLNQSQRDLLLEEMDRIFARNEKATLYREKWESTLEPFFVKNLENVQGDERDVILISTVYGPDESGKLLQRFGPINGRTGHRRLNVLFTRAKERVVVFSSMKPNDIRIDETSSAGLRALRGYLEFAMTGRLETGEHTAREADSDFELFVKERLEAVGYEVVPQVGVSGFFIDPAVRNPDAAGEFILGIECDGAAYQSSKSARDRDRLRQEVLEGLGWKIYRIWSTDWFRDPQRELRKLLNFLEPLHGRRSEG